MSNQKAGEVAIIGAGLAGLALALSLQAKSIPCTLYELRESTGTHGGAIMLSPNALRILDRLGLYSRLRTQGWNFESVTFKNSQGETVGTYDMGNERKYGYKALRIYRKVILAELRQLVQERGISIEYGKRFSHVVSEESNSVMFAFSDGDVRSASVMVGADGIHSTVREYLFPSSPPQYMGMASVTCAVDRATLRFPKVIDYPLPVSIQGQGGVFVLAPQKPDGEELLLGTQFKYPEQDRDGWKALMADKDNLVKLLGGNGADWPDLVTSALENVKRETLNVWPYYIVQGLERWASVSKGHGRVLILGDAAHAVPPTVGQGASQAFESGFSLATVLNHQPEGLEWKNALELWYETRQTRVGEIMALTRRMNNSRLPAAEKEQLYREETSPGDLTWLYDYDVEKDILDKMREKAQEVAQESK